MEFIINGEDEEKLEEFKARHKGCLNKNSNVSLAQYRYTFIPDGFGMFKKCTCCCGESIILDSDYDLVSCDKRSISSYFKIVPKDKATYEIVNRLLSIEKRPGLFLRGQKTISRINDFLMGVHLAAPEKCFWKSEMDGAVWDEFQLMTSDREYSEEEEYEKFFEALHLVLDREYSELIRQ